MILIEEVNMQAIVNQENNHYSAKDSESEALCFSQQYLALYQKIVNFPLDDKAMIIPFAVQLAADNAWSVEYSEQVIKEYKRYLFLMMVAGHKVSPSDQVDQAWHQHMLCSYSYWEDFCENTVQTKIHHWPAGGSTDFHDWYAKTITSYTRFFGHPPPENIWVSPAMRLKTRTYFIRVDKEKNWVFPKIDLSEMFKKSIRKWGGKSSVLSNLINQ
jgi:hypothetical protein